MKLKHKFIDTESEHFLLSDRALLLLFIMVVMLFAGLLYIGNRTNRNEQLMEQNKSDDQSWIFNDKKPITFSES